MRPPNPSPPPDLEERFQVARARTSDINEHLDVIRKYAVRCDHVTEMGTRGADGSTIALLAAQPQTFVAWDINPFAIISQAVADLVVLSTHGVTDFQPRVGDTLKITIEETDLLFIDTLHTGQQLLAELYRHGDRVKKYIIMHDTMTFGTVGEDGKPGLRSAIKTFQLNRMPLWELIEDRENNNGLVVLRHARVNRWEEP